MKRLLSLAHLTAIDLSPPELIQAAAEAEFDAVGLRLIRATETSPGYPLMSDRTLMRETLAALRDTDLRVHDIEFVRIEAETDLDALEPFLDAGAALGAAEVIAAPYDPDLSRLSDRLAALADRAATRGLGVSLEFFPWTVVPDLETAISLLDRAGERLGVLVDSLHFDRSGSSIEMLRQVPRDRLRFAHLSDAPVAPPYSTKDLLYAGRVERLPPGNGQIDLPAFLAALPDDLPLGLEVPMTALSENEGPQSVIRRVKTAVDRLLLGAD